MERYICIHGHFYQPPRENPWLEAIEVQDSAYPFHDWNERITKECYAPNGAARILDQDTIVRIVNNYARMSFNFGPTLLTWLEEQAPDVYQSILKADELSREYNEGHGSAMAQVYNHMIMPLAHARDKETQVHWGIRDFQHRFGRYPQGMWLAETAANTETLEVLAEHGIQFTILSPYQARQVRRRGEHDWHDVTGGRIDPTTPYVQRLPSGREIVLFFYDGYTSQAVAFEGLLRRGEHLAHRLNDAFHDGRDWPQLVHISTDGETYGHHHRHGEMALSYALDYIEQHHMARLTNYANYLAKHPPAYEVEIIENSSWSCYHGVERWWRNCGCNSGGHPDWNQEWRTPLRNALDWLRDTVAVKYEAEGQQFFHDPWAARNDFIQVVLDRSLDTFYHFLGQHAVRILDPDEQSRVLKLLEMQRHAMLMYTSCGWFFDDISGIETVQVVQYAARVIQLAHELWGIELEESFLQKLEQARSNVPEHRDGRYIYQTLVKPGMVVPERVAAHYAVSSLFESALQQQPGRVYCYDITPENYQLSEAGRARLAVGRTRIMSTITRETQSLVFGALHCGNHEVHVGIGNHENPESYQAFAHEAISAFKRSNISRVRQVFEQHFPQGMYSLDALFRNEQRAILLHILDATLRDAESIYRQIYEQNHALTTFLLDLNMPLPRELQRAIEFVVNADLRHWIMQEHFDCERLQASLTEARRAGVNIDEIEIGHLVEEKLVEISRAFSHTPRNLEQLDKLETMVQLAHMLPFEVDLWQTQNIYYAMLQTTYPKFQKRANQNKEDARTWVERFTNLGTYLKVRVRQEREER